LFRTAYDTCAELCVGYAAVGFEPSKSSGRTAGWRLLGAVHVPSSVGALRCADSGRRRWLTTHTLTRGRACASRGGSRGVHVAGRPSSGACWSYRSPTTNGISPRIERALWSLSRVDRRAEGEPRGSGASESGRWRGADPGRGDVTVSVRDRAGARVGRLDPWGRDQVVKERPLGSVGAVRRA
jgi:hypothetical protein